MRKFLIVTLVLTFVLGLSGLALASTGDITQDGVDNDALIDQTYGGYLALIYQQGDENEAAIEQTGGGNNAGTGVYTWDGFPYNYVAGVSTNAPGKNPNWQDPDWGIGQFGNGNKAVIEQEVNSQAMLTQVGDDNQASISQSLQYWNSAMIYQEGDGSIATQVQAGRHNDAYTRQHGGSETAHATQTGGYNYSYQVQTGSTANVAEIKQDGDDNNNPTGATTPPAEGCDCGDCDFTIKMDSVVYDYDCTLCCNFNTGSVTQYQDGAINQAYIDVLGNYNNTCQWQDGDSNFADIDIDGDYNTAKQVQLGSGNEAWITQNGHNNTACQHQNGDGHSTITQTGDRNCACVIQG